jgi:hypothetical protein
LVQVGHAPLVHVADADEFGAVVEVLEEGLREHADSATAATDQNITNDFIGTHGLRVKHQAVFRASNFGGVPPPE